MGILDSIRKLSTKQPAKDVTQRTPQKGEVLRALGKVEDPLLKKSIIELGYVVDLSVDGNNVRALIQSPIPEGPARDQLRLKCLEMISQVDGVESIQVDMKLKVPEKTKLSSDGSLQQQRPEALRNVRHIVAIASGKGGVGKSTTTVFLANALRAQGHRVGILDADIYGPSIPKMSGVAMPTQMRGDLVVPPVQQQIPVISSAMFQTGSKAAMLRGPMVSKLIQQFLLTVDWGILDYLLIDLPPGTGDIQITLAQQAVVDGALLVTTPQEVSLIDVERAWQMFYDLKIPVYGIVESMSYFVCDNCDKKHFIFPQGAADKISQKADVAVLARLPIQSDLAQLCDQGNALEVDALSGLCRDEFMHLADQLVRLCSEQSKASDPDLKSFHLTWSPSQDADAH